MILHNFFTINYDNLSKIELKKYIDEISEYLNQHSYLYHTLDTSIITDLEYDMLFKLLQNLVFKNPELKPINSILDRIGNKILKKFDIIKHKKKMTSLSNVFNFKELYDFYNRIAYKSKIECELKMDGLAISIFYKYGEFYYAATRGDGIYGENVSKNVKTIRNIPLKLNIINPPKELEIRGEIILDKQSFLLLNNYMKKNNNKIFSNPRNAAAGSIRILDHRIVAKRPLKLYAYGIGFFSKDFFYPKTQLELIELLKNFGFTVCDYIYLAKNFEEIKNYYYKINYLRDSLSYYIDGLVFKVNNVNLQNIIGCTNRAPKWAVAYKFHPKEAESEVINIEFQVGRTGVITPVVRLKPVIIDGIKISNATLYNINEINRKDICIGDKVIVGRAGDVIPNIIKSLSEYRKSKVKRINMITNCPVCNSDIKKIDNQSIYRCTGDWHCKAQITERLKHFVSSKAMDIDMIGDKIIKQLVNNNLIKYPYDIYNLTFEQLLSLKRIGPKLSKNILESIKKSKNTTLAKFIFAIGIKDVGEALSILLAKNFNTLEKFQQANFYDLIKIKNIGKNIANNIISFWNNLLNIYIVQGLLKSGIKIHNYQFFKQNHNINFINKIIVITGVLDNFSRKEITKLLENMGAIVSSNISKKTDILIYGNNAGSKLSKARFFGIKTISQHILEKLINY